MNEFIPPFDWQTVVVSPWTDSRSIYIWVVWMGFLVTATCGLVGNYLILRRLALVGDAISHSVLPGLAAAFLVAAAFAGPATAEQLAVEGHHDFRNPTAMFVGALLAGVLTTVLIEVIHKKSRVKQDAAIGISFSTLFAIGVIMISLAADKVDLDQECVLYGEISFVALEPNPIQLGGVTLGPPSVVGMGLVAVVTVALIVLLYKELLVSSFDAGLAKSLGIPVTLIHYGLMGWLSVVIVSAFQSVGAILVIAMLIFPGATGSLLSDRLPVVMVWTVVVAAVSSVLGLHLGLWLNASIAGAMVVMSCFLFVLVWVFSPRHGLVQRWRRRQYVVEG